MFILTIEHGLPILPVIILAQTFGRAKANSMYLAINRLNPVPMDCSTTITRLIPSQVRLVIILYMYFGNSGIGKQNKTNSIVSSAMYRDTILPVKSSATESYLSIVHRSWQNPVCLRHSYFCLVTEAVLETIVKAWQL